MSNPSSQSLSEAHARADVALRQGRWAEAAALLQQLLMHRGADAQAWYNVGYSFQKLGQPSEALNAYQQAIVFGIDAPAEVHLNRAAVYAELLRQPEQAKAELQAALALQPGMVAALVNLGNIHEQQGQRDPAAECYARVLALDPQQPLALARLAGLGLSSGADAQAMPQRLRAAIAAAADPATRADLGFALGHVLDRTGAYDEAFDAYARANRASAEVAAAHGLRYVPAQQEIYIQRLMRLFSQAQPQRASDLLTVEDPGDTDPAPIFICGMFRSGSSLVEQILASHPQVKSLGELDVLPQLAAQALGPLLNRAEQSLPQVLIDKVRHQYRQALRERFATPLRLTDKRPDNFLYVGLVKAMFPTARIVFTQRAALDNCLSVYFLHLSHRMAYATDLLHTAHWYGQSALLMQHWRALWGPDIHTVNYDELVRSPRQHIAALLSYCGLSWHEACLSFHQTPSLVMTPSAWQVRQPLYQRASGRWRHYEKHLGALREALSAQAPLGSVPPTA